MRTLCASLSALLLAVVPGCGNRDTGGGSNRNAQFVLRAPQQAASLKQGESQNINLTLERGKEFNQSVKLEANAPTGVDADLSTKTLKPGDPAEVNLQVKAGKNAPTGEQTVRVIATPDTGNAASVDVKIKVNEAAGARFNVSAPSGAKNVKAGTAHTINLSINREKEFNQTIKLSVEAPKDIKVEVSPTVIRPSDKEEFNLKVDVAREATPGERIIRVIATPEGGSPNAGEVRLDVSKD